MPDGLAFATCDVFTDRAFAGNPLAIVEGADGLSTAAMQTIAREFNLSETIFVMAPRDAAHTARVRIFFPTAEIPFAGHPTIGCAIHLALKDAPTGDFTRAITLEEEAGLVPVEVSRRNQAVEAAFRAPVLPHPPNAGAVPDAALLAEALGLEPADIGSGDHAPGHWQGGPAFLFVPVRSLDVLSRARPCEPAWSRVMDHANVDSAYLYAVGKEADFQARMFSPTAGIPEDPATGSASALLAAQLHEAAPFAEGETQLTLHQGVEMGRPSQIGLRVTVEGGAIEAIHVSGSAVPVSTGRLRVPG